MWVCCVCHFWDLQLKWIWYDGNKNKSKKWMDFVESDWTRKWKTNGKIDSYFVGIRVGDLFGLIVSQFFSKFIRTLRIGYKIELAKIPMTVMLLFNLVKCNASNYFERIGFVWLPFGIWSETEGEIDKTPAFSLTQRVFLVYLSW